jgi:diguanylate cyclase (GGDEF)-like protein/PAS domain S-box-containing protein
VPDTSTELQSGAGMESERASGASPRHADDGDLGTGDRDHPNRGVTRDVPAGAGPMITRVQLDETLAQVGDVVLTVASDGTIGYVSPGISTLLGFDQEEILGQNLAGLLHPDEASELLTKLARRQGHHDVGSRVLLRHAEEGWHEALLFIHAGPALEAAGYRAVVLRDAKDRGHTLDALRQRLAFEDLLTRVASSFIHRPAHEVNECITGALADIGSFVGVDRATVFLCREDQGVVENTHEWTGEAVDPELHKLATVSQASLPEWMGTLERLEAIYIARVADLGAEWRHEVSLLKPGGARSVLAVPLADEGRLIGFIGFDLVTRERIWSDDHIAVLSSAAGIISQALARSDAEQRFGLAFTNAPLGMVLSGPDGRHIQVNPTYCELVGRSESELVGHPALDLIHQDDRAALSQAHASVLVGGREQISLELRVVRPEGELIWVRLHISSVRTGDGKLRYTVSHIEDITERHRQEVELQASEERYRTLVENSPAIVTRFDRDLQLVYASPTLRQASGARPGGDLDTTAKSLGIEHDVRWERSVRQVFETGHRLDTEWEVTGDGQAAWYQSRAVPEIGDQGVVEHVLVMTTDITALKRSEAELAHQALHDPLTGLANRALLLDQLARVLARRDRPAGSVALLFLDLDRFKVVNDSLGHTAGDQLLYAIADRLLAALRPTDVVARLGGDEFVVLIEGLEDPHEPVLLARRIHVALKEPVVVDGNEVFTTVSIGIAVTTSHDDTADGMLRDADAAMYLAKARGRDRYEIFDEDLRTQATERLRTETHLRRALDLGEIEVFYQPELSLDTGMMVGAEALARGHHPVKGLLEAGKFIELAEDSGLILDLGAWVLEEACRQAGEWHRERPESKLMIRVNLSARQIAQPDLVGQVVAAMEKGGIEASSLCLEITETALMADPVAGLKVLQDLRGLGVELAIDDFGTGYSSLSYLKRFPVDVLKIDRSFVDGLGEDPEDTAIVTAIISLGRALGLRVVGEGVETQSQLDELRRLGCDRAQGFMFARPGPAADLWSVTTPFPLVPPATLAEEER